jgi:hypothetical protein
MATAVRPHELKLRLSAAELEIVHARAAGEPVAVWLRELAVDGAPVPRRRRRPPERAVPPGVAELTRAALLAGNHLRRIADMLGDGDRPPPDTLLSTLARIDAYLRRVLEAAHAQ